MPWAFTGPLAVGHFHHFHPLPTGVCKSPGARSTKLLMVKRCQRRLRSLLGWGYFFACRLFCVASQTWKIHS